MSPLVVHTVVLVLTMPKKELLIVQDVESIRDIHFGEIVNYMLVLRNMKLSIVDYAKSFRVNYS